MLRIALPNKGRLADETRELFNDAGLEVRARGERALTASLGDEFEAVFVRAQDIPEFVADGAAEAGVTGRDLVEESERALESLLDLEFGRCRLAVAATDDSGIARSSSCRRARAWRRAFRALPRATSPTPSATWRSCPSPARPRSRRTSASPTSSSISCRPARRCA